MPHYATKFTALPLMPRFTLFGLLRAMLALLAVVFAVVAITPVTMFAGLTFLNLTLLSFNLAVRGYSEMHVRRTQKAMMSQMGVEVPLSVLRALKHQYEVGFTHDGTAYTARREMGRDPRSTITLITD